LELKALVKRAKDVDIGVSELYSSGEEAEKWYDGNTANPKTSAATSSATSMERSTPLY